MSENTTTQSPQTHPRHDHRINALQVAGLVVHLPGSAAYEALTTGYNLASVIRPIAVVEATEARDVARAVTVANEHHFGVGVRHTGHGGSTDLVDQVLIHTGGLTELHIDADRRIARVGAGVRWQQVLDAAAPHGLGALAGSAPNVGVVGYTVGGGLSPFGRTHGLASDRVIRFDVVTGDGRLVRASATELPDLFWALKGGRGVAGIVTAVEFELLPIGEFYGGGVYFDGVDAESILRHWAAWSATLPGEATTSIALLRLPPLPSVPPPLAGRLSVAVRFAWTGSPDEGEQVLAPMRAVATPLLDGIGVIPFAALGAVHADPTDPMPAYEEHTLLSGLPDSAIDALLAKVGGEADCPQIVVELRQLGGAIAHGPDSAYVHRDAAFSLMMIGLGVPPVVEAVAAHAEATLQALEPWSAGRLPNFASRTTGEWYRATYGESGLHRLRRIVKRHDPRNVIADGRALRAATDPSGWRALFRS